MAEHVIDSTPDPVRSGAVRPPTGLPATMRAVVQRGYGGADRWEVAEVPVPSPAADEVLIEVGGAGLDRGTWHLLTGRPLAVRLAFGLRGLRQPVPGMDVAGVVVATGSATTRLGVGDRVFGYAKGSFAPYAVAREKKLTLVPDGLDLRGAAVLAVSGSTALQAVQRAGGVRAGQRVLVIGASGAVGSYVVQLAAAAGGEVTAVCSGTKADLVRSLGAAEVIDRTAGDPLGGAVHAYDLIVDVGGRVPLRRLGRATAPGGTVVLVGGEGGGPLLGGSVNRALGAAIRSRLTAPRYLTILARENHDELEQLAEQVVAGSIRPSIGHTFALAEAAEAMRILEAGRVRGKIAITVGPTG